MLLFLLTAMTFFPRQQHSLVDVEGYKVPLPNFTVAKMGLSVSVIIVTTISLKD
jgi:hypothetical protein